MKHTIFNPAEYLEHNGNNKPDNKRTTNGNNATHDNVRNATQDNVNYATHGNGSAATPDDTLARVAEVADRVAASGRDITQGYDNWLRLAFALSDGLGEAGRQIFDRLSQMNADYDSRECNRLYDNCMKGNKGGESLSQLSSKWQEIWLMWTSRRWQGKEGKERKTLYKIVPLVPLVPMSHCPI